MSSELNTPRGAGRRILVVEDNQDGADLLRMLLELRGHDVRVAYNGLDGVRLALSQPPDFVLCDLGLPGLDGFGVAQALRRNAGTAASRLIAITAYSCDATRRRCREVGFERHLTKPVDLDVLFGLLAAS